MAQGSDDLSRLPLLRSINSQRKFFWCFHRKQRESFWSLPFGNHAAIKMINLLNTSRRSLFSSQKDFEAHCKISVNGAVARYIAEAARLSKFFLWVFWSDHYQRLKEVDASWSGLSAVAFCVDVSLSDSLSGKSVGSKLLHNLSANLKY